MHGGNMSVQIQECAKIPIKIRQALMIQIWSHQRIMDKNQGSSKEKKEYQLKDDLSHMYRFLSRQIIDDIHPQRSEEHTSELQSHYSISYAVFCLLPISKHLHYLLFP